MSTEKSAVISPRRIDPGDDVLVDASMYGPWPALWCRVTRLAPGSAAVYPIKVLLPHGGEGQYKASEIVDHRDRTPEPKP